MKIQVHGKLSINNLIYAQRINKLVEQKGIKITVQTKRIYKDYETYTLQIENTTNNTILIDTRKIENSLYLIGDNGVKYYSSISQISDTMRKIPPSTTKTYDIKFYKIYSSGVEGKAIVLSDIVPDYDKYISGDSEGSKRVSIIVSM